MGFWIKNGGKKKVKSERAKGIGPLILGEKWGGWSIKCADFEGPCVNKKCERWKGEMGILKLGLIGFVFVAWAERSNFIRLC
ncbi:MAG: hypothetical protein JSV99_11115 [Planctomycetota bacterium]|nr:MAG: hypothetical protein JSV99_11115 [Planctomycetota bacterium]